MEEKNTTLTNDQLQSVIDILEESKNEADLLLEQIEKEHENDDNSNAPLEEGIGEYIGDGVIMPVDDDDDDDLDFNHFENIDAALDEIITNNLKDSLAANYNDLSEEEIIRFANLIMKARSNDSKKFNMYNELPVQIQDQIKQMAVDQHIPVHQRNQFYRFTAELMIDELVSDAELDALSIDLEKAMAELVPAPMEMYSEFNKEYIENEFIKVADNIREENPKTADNLLAMREGFIHAYTYENMYEVFKNNKIIKNVRRAEVLWSRTNTEYLRLAEACKFKLYALNDVLNSLLKLGYSETQSKRFITLFVYTYTNGVEDYNDEATYNDIYRNAFANYFQVNVNNLAITPDLLTDFSKEIRTNVDNMINHIDEIIAQKDAELSNKKNKRKDEYVC